MEQSQSFNFMTGKMWTYLCAYSKFNKVPLPFRYSDFSNTVLIFLGGKEDGLSHCPYCKGYFYLIDMYPGYSVPLSRGGSPILSGLNLRCNSCHKHKGELLPDEFDELLKFIEMKVSLKRKQIINRNKTEPTIR